MDGPVVNGCESEVGKLVTAQCGEIFRPMCLLFAGNELHCAEFNLAWQRFGAV